MRLDFRRMAALGATVLLALAAPAHAQQAASAPASGVQESTDPAKAAAIEKAAAALKNRPPQPAVGLVRAKTADGHDLLSGGVTQADRVTMHSERQRYGLWVATVAKPSGAYLADVDLRITRVAGKAVVLERKMEGPWLLVALPEGQYDVVGTFREPGTDKPQTLTQRISVPKSGQRQAVLRFDSKAAVDTDAQRVFKGNPFGNPTPTTN